MGKISREDQIAMKALRVAIYEWEKLEFTPLYERICEPKVVQIVPRSTYKTRSQAVARIADRTASQQTLVISDCC